MAGDQVKAEKAFMDMNYHSLASQELDLKQMELDSAAAKLDVLRRELENKREAGNPIKGQSKDVPTQGTVLSLSPSLTRKSIPSPNPVSITSNLPVLKPRPQESMPVAPQLFFSHTPSGPSHPISPTLTRRTHSTDSNTDSYLSAPLRSPRGRPSSPRLHYYERSPSPRLLSGSYDYPLVPRSASPVPDMPPGGMYTEWGPPQRHTPAYEVPPGFVPRFSDDVSSLRRRPPQRNWNESDLDVSYEKKPSSERSDRAPIGGLPLVGAWRESSLDAMPAKGKGDSSSTLPRGYKFSSGTDRISSGVEPVRRSGTGTLPRSLPTQQPISRIPVPPPQGRNQPHRPLPLSMIFRLQNAFWEHQTPPPMQSTQPPVTMVQPPPLFLPVVPDLPLPAVPAQVAPQSEEVPRPLSPTRLQPTLPPSLAEVQRVLEDMPRPLRRRGSQEHTSQGPLLPSHNRQYKQIMGRLFGRAPSKLKTDEKFQGSSQKYGSVSEEQGTEDEMINTYFKTPTIIEDAKTEEKLSDSSPNRTPSPEEPPCIIIEGSESRVGACPVPSEVESGVPVVIGGNQTMGLRSALKGRNSPRKSGPRRARLDPLIMLLDGALTGELDVVTQALREVNDPSLPNEEGITALHNAICGANYHIVNLLVNSGANVNAADSHGWTPLHCAASCNDTQMCSILVRHGAAIFATTYSDGSLAVDRCDPYQEGYKECITFLTEVEQCMGETQSGVVYALWDYTAEFSDELSFREGDTVTVLRKDGDGGNWWWASLCGREGYVPRNYFGMYPRVRPQRSPL
ncbi:relA-associated inhibitor isoform X2 [Bombina bombina]|nr:relA-associated inhibitor isoform X2 [Bombina bombina]